eukprot:403349200
MNKENPSNPEIVSQLKFNTQDEKSLGQCLKDFIEHSGIDVSQIQCAVLGIAGPVMKGSVTYQLNISHWCPIREQDLERETGLKKVKLINDFVANGYGMLSLEDKDTYHVIDPEEGPLDDTQRLVFGIGTGCGVCQLMRPELDQEFHVYPSEAGIIKLQLYNDTDREFEDFLQHEKKVGCDDIQLILSGRGIKNVYEFLAAKYPKPSRLLTDKSLEDIKPEDISRYAEQHDDELCLDTLNYFIDYLAKYLGDMTFTFMPLGGIYLTASVILAMEFMFERPEVRKRFLDIYHNRGGMTSILKRVPIKVVKKDDLAIQGCINCALYQKHFKF